MLWMAEVSPLSPNTKAVPSLFWLFRNWAVAMAELKMRSDGTCSPIVPSR